jgi:ligand-binding sensor domain-containing protein
MKYFLFFILLYIYFNSISQNYSFVSYSTSAGLPQSQVTSIVQDSNGYLWVGTLGGLAKFNGKDFITFSTESGLVNNRISSLAFIDGNLWIGHQGGITLLNKSKLTKWELEGDNKFINVKSILKYNGSIYIATNGGGLFKLQGNKLKQVHLVGYDCSFIRDMEVFKGTLYLATRNGVIYTRDLKKMYSVPSLKESNISGIDKWCKGLIFSAFENELYSYDIKQKKIKSIELSDKNTILKSIYVDSKLNCWISTETGFYKLDKDSNLSFISEKNGLPIGVISCVFEDKQKNVWLGR